MTLDEFTRLLDTYGADLSRWPENDRDEAVLLRRALGQAQVKWQSAEALEALFRRDRAREDIAGRNAAIINATLRRIRADVERSFDWRWLLTRPWGTAAAAAVLAGWVAGVVIGPSLEPPPQRHVSAIAALLDGGANNIEDLL
jgi:hypothetical protein